MKKTLLILTAFLVLIAVNVSAEQIISVDLTIYKNYTVQENSLVLLEGVETEYYQRGDRYRFEIYNVNGNKIWEKKFDVQSFLHFQESSESEGVRIVSNIPYSREMNELRLYKWNDELIYSKILNFCNNDGICDVTELSLYCPQDCPSNEKDKLCNKELDLICDPDCAEGVDPDCEFRIEERCGDNICGKGENYFTCKQDCKFNWVETILVLMIALLIVGVIYFIKKIKIVIKEE